MVILVDTFNGEGYSNPKVIQSNDVFKDITDIMKEYGTDFKVEITEDGNIAFDNNIDQGSIHKLDVLYDGYTILVINPDVNKVSIKSHFNTLAEAKEELGKVVNSGIYVDEDEIDEYDDDDISFGGHTDDGFSYLEIVGNRYENCPHCGEDYSSEHDPSICPNCLTSI